MKLSKEMNELSEKFNKENIDEQSKELKNVMTEMKN